MTASGTPWRRTPRYERIESGQRVTHHDGNRRCAHPSCETKLSRYNPDGTCSRHGGWSDPSVASRGPRAAAGELQADY